MQHCKRPGLPARTLPVILVILALLSVHAAQAQTAVTTPKAGSAERKAIMDALRAPIAARLKQKVIFVVQRLKVQRGYAFVIAQPQQPDGKKIDYSRTDYATAVKEGAFDDQVVALLKRQGRGWRVLVHSIGATDVVWEGWAKTYGAPAAIFKE